MAGLSHLATLSGDPFLSDDYITGLAFADLGGASYLYTGAQADGGLTAFRLAAGAAPVQIDAVEYTAFTGTHTLVDLNLTTLNGAPTLLSAGRWDDMTAFRYLAADGRFAALDLPSTGTVPTAHLTAIDGLSAHGQDWVVTTGAWGSGLELFSVTGAGDLSPAFSLGDDAARPLDRVGDLAVARANGTPFVLAASPADNAISAWRLTAGGTLEQTGVFAGGKGVGIQAPDALAVAEVAGETYVIAAAGTTSTLSVLRLGENGSLTETDRVADSFFTRFANAPAVAAVVDDGMGWVAAGGMDGGLTLFALTPGGQLVAEATVIDSQSTTLASVSAVGAHVVGGEVQVVAASASEPGVTVLRVDAGTPGLAAQTDPGGGVLTGGAADDRLSGNAGRDRIDGGAGADILFDGADIDVLTGGAGADIFVMAQDGAPDRIADFEPGIDRIDLSGRPLLYSAASLHVTPTAQGARIEWWGEVLDVITAAGTPLEAADLTDSDFIF